MGIWDRGSLIVSIICDKMEGGFYQNSVGFQFGSVGGKNRLKERTNGKGCL